jgi:hypothetical protein
MPIKRNGLTAKARDHFEQMFHNELAYIEGALDVEFCPCHDTNDGTWTLYFPFGATHADDYIQFSDIKAALDFVSNVSLLIRMGREQRRSS